LIAAALIFAASERDAANAAESGDGNSNGGSLLEIASKLFPGLTRAERALLEHADVKNVGRGDYAVAGTTANYESETYVKLPDDPPNDPQDAEKWDSQRQIRASLIRWMCVDPDAIRRTDPRGIKVLGAKIVGRLNLSGVKVPFAITLRRCSIPELMDLSDAEMPALDLAGSYTGPIHAAGIKVTNALLLSKGFHANGIVNLQEADLGTLGAVDGHFQWSPEPGDYLKSYKTALNLLYAKIRGTVNFVDGFESHGEVSVYQATIGGDLGCDSGHFINPGNLALDGQSANIAGNVMLMSAEAELNTVEKGGYVLIDGVANFGGARVAGAFLASQVKIMGSAGQPHGFLAPGMVVKGAFVWNDVKLENGAPLNLSQASVGSLIDQERSWPTPGNLLIDGFTYTGFGQLPNLGTTLIDAHTRLGWLRLQPPGFHPQPYRQLAKVLRENGDEPGAIRVLIAGEDERYRQYGWPGAILGGFLKRTIGYGHRPMLTVFWMLGVVGIGWLMAAIGKRSGVMRLTWPETTPPPTGDPVGGLSPLLYSLDVFVPFVNLHQEHYWWPDEAATGEYKIFGYKFPVHGSLLRRYLWLQIFAGWLLSAIFIAGVTGLIRSD